MLGLVFCHGLSLCFTRSLFVLPSMVTWKRENGYKNLLCLEDDMGLFVFLLAVVCIVFFFILGRNRVSNNSKVLMEKDDFAGDSIGSLQSK